MRTKIGTITNEFQIFSGIFSNYYCNMAAKTDKSLIDIVKERMEDRRVNVQVLSKQTGIPADRIYKWFQRNLNPKLDDADKLREWLNSSLELVNVPREALAPSYIDQRRWGKMVGEDFFVPLVPYKARAGYSKNYENTDYINDLETFQIPPGVKWRGSDWRWFEVGGDSMEPLLYEGDILLCSLIPEADWLDIDPFLIYVVVWKNEVSVKRVAINNGDFVLISENESEHPQKRILITDVKEVWKLRRQLNSRFPPTKRFRITV